MISLLEMLWAFYRKKTHLNYPPFQIHVEPTNICNLHCPMCISHEIPKKRKGYIGMDLVKKIAQDPFAPNSKINLWLFGEGMLHPKFSEIVRIFREGGRFVSLTTNGTCITRRKAEELIDAGLNTINISLHMADTLKQVAILMDVRRKKQSDINVYVETLNLPQEQLDEVQIRQIRECGAKYVTKEPMSWGGSYDIGEYDKSRYYVCPHPYTQMNITWDGTAICCCRDYQNKFVLGDANKESIEQIWNGKRMQGFRQMLINGTPPAPCSQCEKIHMPLLSAGRIVRNIKLRKRK